MSYQNREEYIKHLSEYVVQAVNDGHHVTDIRDHLVANGHPQDVVEEAILKA